MSAFSRPSILRLNAQPDGRGWSCRAFPESSPVALGPVRRKVISAFPYSVTYSLIDEVIVVLAFAHHSRQPLYWRGRE